MKIIIGLGNPGPQYARTRHNVGRLFVEFLAEYHGQTLRTKKKLHAAVASFDLDDQSVVLARPEDFMNVSGNAVRLLAENFNVDPGQDLLVAVDDMALPLGRIRLRSKGSDGGHNGLKSIQEALGTQNFARIRFGIGHPRDSHSSGKAVIARDDVKDYVLESFRQEEAAEVGRMLERGLRAASLWFSQSISAAMNYVNCL